MGITNYIFTPHLTFINCIFVTEGPKGQARAQLSMLSGVQNSLRWFNLMGQLDLTKFKWQISKDRFLVNFIVSNNGYVILVLT